MVAVDPEPMWALLTVGRSIGPLKVAARIYAFA